LPERVERSARHRARVVQRGSLDATRPHERRHRGRACWSG
jgi:hypothetical protein